MIKAIILLIAFAILTLFLIYFGSKIQIRAWLSEIDKFLTDKSINLKNKENGKEEK